MDTTQFTYKAAEKKCPSCDEPVISVGGYFFCEREQGTRTPSWANTVLPVATKTARTGRFFIAGKSGFWKIPSHADNDLQHDGPGEGTIIASLLRYHAKTPTAVVFVQHAGPRSRKGPKAYVKKSGCPYRAFIDALTECRMEDAVSSEPLKVRDIPEERATCLIPGCSRTNISRGLCRSCHNSAHTLIANRGATWGELEDYGLARAKMHSLPGAP